MIRNYLETAVRSMRKNKTFTLINGFGLALGLASLLLIVFYVFDELTVAGQRRLMNRLRSKRK